MVQGNGDIGINGSVLSPRENSLCAQMIANVLESSPGSLSTRDKFSTAYSTDLTKFEDAKTTDKNDGRSTKSANDTLDSNKSTPFIQIPYQPPSSDSLALGTTPEYQEILDVAEGTQLGLFHCYPKARQCQGR
ncbi:unnamed protein product [Gongylonema pulchrum]|uniref:Uncharacterized protein n=1 Tax=Gongylonema pulchrum TaxID=637853 RepID=A0A183DWY0_9BILA|nr:unnamed protein product [Gongylonema pulchrum]